MALTRFTTGNRGPDHLTRPPEYKPLPKPKPRAPDHLTRPVQGRGPVLVQAAPQPQPVFQVVQPQPVISPEYVSMYRPAPAAPAGPMWKPTVPEALGMYGINVQPSENQMQVGYDPSQAPREIMARVQGQPYGTYPGPQPGTLNVVNQQVERDKQRRAVSENMARYYDNMARMGEKDRLRREREANDRSESPKALTIEEWNAYSPLQQAGVMANADLAAAIKRDFNWKSKNRVDPTDEEAVKTRREQLDKYLERLKDLGIEGAGFQGLEYAPNTVAFLDERGITGADLKGKTLDDLISGDELMTKKTVDQFGRRNKNLAFAETLAKGQLAYQEELAKKLKRGDQLLMGISQRTTNSTAASQYGAKEMRTNMKLTKVRPEMLEQLDKYFEIVSRPDIPVEEGMQNIQLDLEQRGAEQEEVDQIYQALLERARQGMTGENEWFDSIDYEMRTPQEVAQILNAPMVKRAEGTK